MPLTPRVASPTRLFRDSSGTPLLELPEEKLDNNNEANKDATVPPLFIDENNIKQPPTDLVEKPLPLKQNDMSLVKEGEDISSANERIKKVQEEELIKAAALKSQVEVESKVIMEAAVKRAKAEAEVEAARIIARAKAEIEVAKASARKQSEIEDAVKRATQIVEQQTKDELSRLQRGANTESDILDRGVHPNVGNLDSNNQTDALHEGDLYWDENDNIAGGNKLRMPVGDEKISQASVSSKKASKTGSEVADSEDNAKSERKSKIPKLVRSSSSASSIDNVIDDRAHNNPKANITDKAKQQMEARARIQRAKREFKNKQNEKGGRSNSMMFIASDNDEVGPGDESLPEERQEVNDDESVASTTVGDDVITPRKSTTFPGQGNRPDTIRALREISQQREHMDKALAELKR